jgi:hypothetical protein
MSRFPSLDGRKGTHLPKEYWPSHELCFRVHDVMTQLLVSGERARAFYVSFDLPDEAAKREFENAFHIFQWLENHRPPEDRATVLVTTMFPAILSDMLHCFYEALETSRKAKLGISFMLLRKPLQESLYVLEAVIADRTEFAQKLTEDPIELWSQGIGGREPMPEIFERFWMPWVKAIGLTRPTSLSCATTRALRTDLMASATRRCTFSQITSRSKPSE